MLQIEILFEVLNKELISKFASAINQPMSKFASVLNSVMTKFVGTLNSLKDNK